MSTEITTSLLGVLTSTLAAGDVDSAASAASGSGNDGGHVDEVESIIKGMTKKSLDEELHYVMSAVVGPIFCFVGMLGNLLSIITWLRPKMRSSTGRYLIGQALADFGVLLFFILVDSLQQWCPDVVYSVTYGLFFCYIGYPGLFFFVVCSIWFTVGVTADRYIMVCWITKAKRYCSENRANFGLLLIAVNSFMVNFPHHFSYTPVFPSDNSNNNNPASDATALVLNSTGTRSNGSDANPTQQTMNEVAKVKTFKATEFTTGPSGQFYEFWVHCIILILVPWFTVCMMNVMIIKTVNHSNKKNADKKTMQAAKNSKDSENQITRLLLTVTFTFLFFIGLQCVIQCIWMQKPSGANMFLVSSSFAFAKCGIIFNSSLNFFLYCLTGKRFRKELLKVLGISRSDHTLSSMSERPSTGSTSRNTTSTTGTTGM